MNTDANSTTSFTDSWFCPACDTEIFEPNHNCHNCGYVRKHCPICKTPVYCQIKVCEKCGAAITNNNQDTTKHEIKTDGSICNTNLQNDSSEVNKRIARTQGENAINFKKFSKSKAKIANRSGNCIYKKIGYGYYENIK